MRDTIIMMVAIVVIFGITAYVNASDIAACVERGNSEQMCNHTFNR